MYGPRRISSCGNPIPKTVGIVAKREAQTSSLQCAAPECPRQTPPGQTSVHGENCRLRINDALLAVDLNTVELVNLQSEETDRKGNASRHLAAASQAIHQVAQKRKCSMNQLVNSALLAYLLKDEKQTQKTD